MEKKIFISHSEETKEKTIKDYCEDIINACYYDLSKLIELKVIKAEYDENNKVTWYIAGSDQAYTNYRELRKGLESYVLHIDNGKYFKEEEFFDIIGELISKGIHTLILSKELVYSGIIRGRINYDETLLKTHWNSIEERMRILSNSPLWINDVIEYSIADYRLFEATIKNKNIKNVFIDFHPNKDEMSEILSWGEQLGINVFFTELGAIDSFNSKESKSGCGIFAESDVHVHFN